jgi:hypothetical protein
MNFMLTPVRYLIAPALSRATRARSQGSGLERRTSLRRREHALSKRRVHVFGQRDEFAIIAKSTDVAIVVIVAIALFGGDVALAFDNNRISLCDKLLRRVAVSGGKLGKKLPEELRANRIPAAPCSGPGPLSADRPCEVVMHCVDKGLAVAIGQFRENDLHRSFVILCVHDFRVLRGVSLPHCEPARARRGAS